MKLRWMAASAALFGLPLVAMADPGAIDHDYGDLGRVPIDAVTDNVGVGPLRVDGSGQALISFATDPESGSLAIVDATGTNVHTVGLGGPGAAAFGPDNSVYAAFAQGGQVWMSRYGTDGSLDPTFGTLGKAMVDLVGADVSGIVADGDGVIAFGGASNAGGPIGWAARFDADGSADATFGTSGIANLISVPMGTADSVHITGMHGTAAGYVAVALLRGLTEDSVRIVSVGSDGASETRTSLFYDDEIFSVESLSLDGGSVLAAVQTTSGDVDTFHLVKVGSTGTDFEGFSDPGLTADEVGGPVHLAQLRDGSLLVGYNIGPDPTWTLRRVGKTGIDLGEFVVDPTVSDLWIYGLATSHIDGGLFIAVDESPVSSIEADDITLVKLIGDESGRFIDDDDSVHESDISELARRGITRGCNPPVNTQFCPDDPVTRAQMAAFLVRALELPVGNADAFSDDNGSLFEGDINALAAAGITRGCDPPVNTRFCPDDPVTRAQMAAFLVRALELPVGNADAFSDDNGSLFEGDINALAAAGITRGCDPPVNTLFCPDDPVTRAQMASFLIRGLARD